MTNEVAIRYCDEYLLRNIADIDKNFLKKAKEALQQKTCEDCISRQAVLDILVKYDNDMGSDVYREIFDNIDKLPSVTPQPKMGQWIEHVERDDWDDSEEVWYECDQCHVGSGEASNYCPNCGAKMVKSQISELENPFNDSRFGG